MRLTDIIRIAKDYLALGIVAVLFLAIAFITGYFLIYRKGMKGKKKINAWKLAVASILFCYFVIVLGATLGSRSGLYQGSVILYPFNSYREAWNSFSIAAWRNIILNIMMFVPFGFLLPVFSEKFRNAWKTYLVGFALTLCIECTQMFTGRGIFEADDIIGNTTGIMIGYGLIGLTQYLIERFRNRPPIITGKKAVAYQIPLLITIMLFSGIFLTYSSQELGNLSIAHSFKYNMTGIFVEPDVSLSGAGGRAYVYKAEIGSKEETLQLANSLLKNLSTQVDEEQNDYYNDTAVYKSLTGNHSVWIDYAGLTVWFNDYSQREKGKRERYTLDEVTFILRNYNITLPKDIGFEDKGNGDYTLTANMSEYDNGYINGTLTCTITKNAMVSSFRNNLIQYEKFKEYEIISEQQAFENLKEGKVNHRYLYGEPKSIEVKKVKLDYHMDSKGYYQPIYLFEALVNDERTEIPIAVVKGK